MSSRRRNGYNGSRGGVGKAVKDIQSEMIELLRDKEEELLLIEKERRGIDPEKLVFIGMADTANYYWCAVKSLLSNKKMELPFFRAYLYDRILYSFKLGYLDKLPKSEVELLEIGDRIGFQEIEELLGQRAEKHGDVRTWWTRSITVTDKDGKKVELRNPLFSTEGELKELTAKLERYPRERGILYQQAYGEYHPTIRWNFTWNDYTVIGVPDGITEGFVYEFKTTRNRYLINFVKPVALTQADLYGYFFKRDKKRVQIYVVEEATTVTWEEEINRAKAEEVLNKFKSVDEGASPIPPKKWKCKSCEFQEVCEIRGELGAK